MTTWSAWVNHLQLGWDLIAQDTAGITVRFTLQTSNWGWSDPQTFNYSGSQGTNGSVNYTASAPGGFTGVLATWDIRYPSGPGTSINFSASITGVYLGSGPSVSGTASSACAIPSQMPMPSVNWVNQTQVSLHGTGPSSNGGCGLSAYLFRISTDPNMGTYSDSGNIGVLDYQFNGLIPNTTYYAWTYALNAAGYSPASPRLSFTTPANAPAAPTIVSAVCTNDTTQVVTWTNNATAPAPYTNILVQRQTDGGGWATIATIAGTATNFTDTSTAANHVYDYRVLASNNGGNSAASAVKSVGTTPAAPSGVGAVRGTGATVILTWTNNSLVPYETVIEESDGAGGWTAQTVVASGTTTWTDTAPNAGTTQYRLTARSLAVPGPVILGTPVLSPTVVVITPPNAPSPTAPVNTVLDVAGVPTVFTWLHNPVDGSAQTSYQLQYRIQGAGGWTTLAKTASAAQTVSLATGTLSDGHIYEWQVRTWGAATTGGSDGAGGSPWSATAVFTASARPTVTIATPTNGATLSVSSLTTTWVYFDAEGTPQAQWRARLFAGVNTAAPLLETLTGATTAASATFATTAANGATYTIAVDVQDGSGLWSTVATVTVTISYLPPAPINAFPVWDEPSGSVAITLVPQAPVAGVSVAQVSATIERSIDSGPWVVVAANVPPDSAVVDTQPSTRGTNCYRVTGRSALPSTLVQTPVCVVVDSLDNGYLTAGPAFDQLLVLMCDLASSATTGRAKTTYNFAGRDWPVEFSGQSLHQAVSVKGTVRARIDPAETMAQTPGIVLWRDPSGRRVYASLSDVNTAQRAGMAFRDIWDVSFTLTRVDVDA